MASETQILKEYLVALGFRVDETGARKVDGFLTGLDKKSLMLGKTLVGVATATVTLTTLFARSMEKMYYAARYADTTVGKLQELEYAGRNVGLGPGQASAALKSMAEHVRANPGLVSLLEKMGVPVKGRTMDKVMLDFVRATKSMPFYVAQRYASLFGIDAETLFNMQKGLGEMDKAAQKRREMAAEMGVDADKAAEVGHEYMNMWREVTERAGLFGQAIGTLVMPEVKKLVTTTNDLMKDWVQIAREIDKSGSSSFWQSIRIGTGFEKPGGGVQLTDEAKKRIGADPHYDPNLGHVPRWKRILRRIAPNGYFGAGTASDPAAVDAVQDTSDRKPGYVTDQAVKDALARQGKISDAGDTEPGGVDQPGFDPKDYLASLEKRYALPPGILDRVWQRESSRGANMRSPKGAKGHFGFMDATAKEYGLKDPDDFKESADAAARKWHDLLRQYHGNTRMAAAAYNWGDGNLARYGLGMAPKETRGYMDAVAGKGAQVEMNTEVHVHGVSDPERAADSVVRKQREVVADVARNLGPKVR